VADEIRIVIESEDDVVAARRRARQLGESLGFASTDLTLLATAISEVARNITTYASRGEIALYPVNSRGRSGIKVVATDEGPGIPDVDAALQDGFSTGAGLGLGLPGARRLVDEFEIESGPSAGTKVTLVKWGRTVDA
jgi:serine/threonine-protein kinase RsbT